MLNAPIWVIFQNSVTYKQVASLLAAQNNQRYSSVMSWIRCSMCFSLLRSAVTCLCGMRSHCDIAQWMLEHLTLRSLRVRCYRTIALSDFSLSFFLFSNFPSSAGGGGKGREKLIIYIENLRSYSHTSSKNRTIDLYSEHRRNKLQALTKTVVAYQQIEVRSYIFCHCTCHAQGNGLLDNFYLYSSLFTAFKCEIHEEKLIAYYRFDVM